eukprot:869006-Rhodomonas_salina.1
MILCYDPMFSPMIWCYVLCYDAMMLCSYAPMHTHATSPYCAIGAGLSCGPRGAPRPRYAPMLCSYGVMLCYNGAMVRWCHAHTCHVPLLCYAFPMPYPVPVSSLIVLRVSYAMSGTGRLSPIMLRIPYAMAGMTYAATLLC